MNIIGTPGLATPYFLPQFYKLLPVFSIVIDFKPREVEIRILYLKVCDERLHLLAMTATIPVKIKCGYGTRKHCLSEIEVVLY